MVLSLPQRSDHRRGCFGFNGDDGAANLYPSTRRTTAVAALDQRDVGVGQAPGENLHAAIEGRQRALILSTDAQKVRVGDLPVADQPLTRKERRSARLLHVVPESVGPDPAQLEEESS